MTIWKPALVGATALLIAGSTVVYAQQRQDRQDARRWQPNVDDVRAFNDARLAGLKAGLALKPEQEKNWPAFEQAARDIQKLRVDRLSAGIEARRNGSPRLTNPIEHMEQRANVLAESGAALKKLAEATAPLYTSLDDAQKRRFNILGRSMTMGDGFAPRQRTLMRDRFMRRTEVPGLEDRAALPGHMQGLDGRAMQDRRIEGFDMRMPRANGRSLNGTDSAPMRSFNRPMQGGEDL
jgi:zinc resistance-associated protein